VAIREIASDGTDDGRRVLAQATTKISQVAVLRHPLRQAE
jgi:hypothetical protein